MDKKLERSSNKMLAGVCAGIADYLDVDVTLVRGVAVGLTLMTAGAAVPVMYALGWALIPEAGSGHIVAQDLINQVDKKIKEATPTAKPGSTPDPAGEEPAPWEQPYTPDAFAERPDSNDNDGVSPRL